MAVAENRAAKIIMKIEQSAPVDGIDELALAAFYINSMRAESQTAAAVAARNIGPTFFGHGAGLGKFLLEIADNRIK